MKESATRVHRDKAISKGLTIEEMRTRMIVNTIKIKMEQQYLIASIIPGQSSVDSALRSNMSRFEQFMKYATITVSAFRIGKKAFEFIRNLKK